MCSGRGGGLRRVVGEGLKAVRMYKITKYLFSRTSEENILAVSKGRIKRERPTKDAAITGICPTSSWCERQQHGNKS